MSEASIKILVGDSRQTLKTLPDASVHCCVTSPPYWGLRDYGHPDQIGLEETPEEYVANLVTVFREVHRVLRDDGTCWVNLGDSYANVGKWGGSSGGKHAKALHGNSSIGRGKRDYGGLRNKELIGIPWTVAFALRSSGWILRQDIIWSKPNPMPASVRDRCTTAHEYLFLLVKSPRYFWNKSAMQEPAAYAGKPRGGSKKRYEQNSAGMDCKIYNTRNRRSVWSVGVHQTFKCEKHFAMFPPALIKPCILAGTPPGGTVLDPFGGAGTTAVVAHTHGRNSILCELNNEYAEIATNRLLRLSGYPLFATHVEIEEGETATQESTVKISKEFI